MSTPSPLRFFLRLAGLILLANGASAQIWIGGGANSNWTTAANWSTGAVPANGGTATFSNNTAQDPNLAIADQIGKLVFTVGSDAEVFTGSTLRLNAVSGVGLDNQSGVTQTFSNILTISADQTWNAGSGNFAIGAVNLSNNNTAHTLTFSGAGDTAVTGVIANGGNGAGSITKTGAGTLALSGVNTYTGITTVNAGTLSVGSIGNGGVAGNLGAATNAAGNLILGGGTLEYTGATASTNRAFTLTSGTTSTISVTGAGSNLTMSGAAISTTGALTKEGAGTLTFSGSNLYTGGTTINTGTLALGASNVLANSGAVNVNGGTFAIGTFSDTVGAVTLTSGSITGSTGVLTGSSYGVQSGSISANLAGTSALTKSTAGTVTLSGTNTYTGATAIDAGVLNIGNNSALGGTANGTTVAAGAALQLQGGITVTGERLTLTGSGIAGDGALRNISGDNTWTGNVTLLGGNPFLQSDSGLLTLSGTLTGSNQSITVGGAGNTLLSGLNDTGSGTLTKNGTGTLTLTGTASRSTDGGTQVNDGTLALSMGAGVNALGVGSPANATIIGDNIGAAGSATLSLLANSQISDSTPVTINSDGRFSLNVFSETIDSLDGTGVVDLGASGSLTVGFSNSSFLFGGTIVGSGSLTKIGTGTFTLAGNNTYTGTTTINAGTVSVATIGDAGVASNLGAATNATTSLVLGGGTLAYTGATASTNRNFALTGGTTSTINVIGATNLTMSGVVANGGVGNGALTKAGAGTLTLSGTNTYTGVTTINAGALTVGSSGALGGTLNGTTVVAGAALQLQGGITVAGENLSLAGSGINLDGALRNISGNNTWSGNVTLLGNPFFQSDSGLLTVSGNLSGSNQSITVGGAGDTLLSGGNNTGSGTLTKNGTGTLTLAGSASRNTDGDTQVNDGTVALNMADGVNALAPGPSATVIGDNIGAASSATLSLLASNQIADSTPVTINSDGRFSLNFFSETISTVTGSGQIDLGSIGSLTVGASNGTSTFGGTIVGSGSLAKTGSGTFTLAGNNTYTGATTVSSGILNIQSATALGAPGTGTTVASGATLQMQGGLTVAEGLTLNGTGVTGAGALESLSGNNTWTGNITLASDSTIEIDAGTLTLSGNITDNGGSRMLTLDTKGSTEISGSISGTTALDKEGSSTLTLTGANTFTGLTTIRVGAVNLQNGSALGSGASTTTVSNLAALQLQNNITVTGEQLNLAGTGQGGTGALRNISGSNTWAGDIIISANSSIASDAGGLLTISGNIINNGFNRALTVTGAGDTLISGGINTDTGELFKQGTGTLTLTGTGTFTGSTFVDVGVLNIEANNALGSTLSGTTVTTGAALQLQSVTGISVAGHLTLNGTGIANDGALRNISGNNTWAGPVTLVGNNTLIQSDSGLLTVSGDLSGNNQSVTVGGAGDTLLSGTNNTGSGTLTKNGTGTLTLTGSTSRSTDGGTLVNDGTLALNMSPGVNALGVGGGANATIIGDNVGTASSATLSLLSSNQISDSTPVTINSDGRLVLNNFSEAFDSLSGTGVVDLGASGVLTVGTNNGSSFFGGSIIGAGTLIKLGTGALALQSSIVLAGELQLKAGTLALGGYNLTANTLHITGNSSIDFAGGNSSLNLTNLIIDAGFTLTVLNWTDAADYFYTMGWTGATLDTSGTAPMNQVIFVGFSGNSTRWQSYDHQVTPVPEPSTYGLVLLLGTGGLGAWRRWRRARAGRAS